MSRTKVCATLNIIGLACSFVGGLLLLYSLSVEQSNYKLVEKSDHTVAICVSDKVVEAGFGGPLVVTEEPCPEGIRPSVAAVIGAERPRFLRWGLLLISIGFGLQLPAAFVPVITH